MSTRFTVTVRCDEQSSPFCLRERAETHDRIEAFDQLTVHLLQEGWDWDGPQRGHGPTHDVCPACLEEKTVAENPDRAE